ncbi:tyrosine-type recombinase/integrase [Intrasporangium chromatireducens]|uniref:tyrosine-type recombinase/integrase n=1 Tax=Intrasporangium chromatireducens TaxID=1386088 RepID=UPI0004ACC0F1|nr:site-specific integrase [Intrasporangium chromatireducens]
MASGKRLFGGIERLSSGRYRAKYRAPDGKRYAAPVTFDTRLDAEAWLTDERRKISAGTWEAPRKLRDKPAAETLGTYAEKWMRRRDLKPRTREHYRSLLDRQILPALGEVPLKALTSEMVRDWHADLDRGRPTLRAHAYGLLRTILGTAVADEKIAANPCHVRGAGQAKRARKIKPATLRELEIIAAEMPEKYRPMVMLSAWCALRFGEVTELRRKDVDLKNGVIHVRRGVVRAEGEEIVGTPKSDAGTRDVAIPPHLLPMLKAHRDSMPMRGQDALLFPAADGVSHLAPSTLYRVYYPARKAAGRPDLRWHDLRHTGATLAAQTGATLAELMGRLGHSTPGAAMKYQHIAQGRDAEIAAALSRMVEANR